MSSPFSDQVLAHLSAFATSEFGLRFPPDRWPELGRGIAAAALDLGVTDLETWAANLAGGALTSEQRTKIANHLTISETYFFRQRDAFDALETEILPERFAQRSEQGRPLRIWSAGCASGEEPYSIAILLRQKFPALRREMAVISGTDLNTHVLARAVKGIYSEWSFRDAPNWLKPTYFQRAPLGHFQLVPEIRQMVRFSQLNLAAPFYPAEFGERGDFDVILCRNVLMYFTAEWQDRIIRRFAQALVPDGWLIVGPCDVTAAESSELRLRTLAPGIHQKRGRIPRGEVQASELPPTSTSAPLTVFPTPPTAPLEYPVFASPPRAADPKGAPAEITELPGAADRETYAALARICANRGDLEEALAACDRAIAEDTLDASLHHLRGTVLLELSRIAEAEQAFRRVLYLEPTSAMAEFHLASLARAANREAEARHRFAAVLRLLGKHNRGEAVPDGDGLTAGRLQQLVENALADHAA